MTLSRAPIEAGSKLECVSYAPFRGGQTPLDPTTHIEAEQITQDLAQLAKISNCVRTYSVDNGVDQVPAIAARVGLKVLQGIWLGNDRFKNQAQIAAAVALAMRLLSVADGSDYGGSLRNPAGWNNVFGLALIPLTLTFAIFALAARNAPNRPAPKSVADYLKALGDRDSWWFMFFYSVTFGGFLGLASTLPGYFHDQYAFDPVKAGYYTAACVFAGATLSVRLLPILGSVRNQHHLDGSTYTQSNNLRLIQLYPVGIYHMHFSTIPVDLCKLFHLVRFEF